MTTAFRWLRDHYLVITALSGVILIAMGLLLFTGELHAAQHQGPGTGSTASA